MDLKSMIQPRFQNIGALQTPEDLVSYVRAAVRDALGDDLNRVYLQREIATQAATQGYFKGLVPVVVLGCSGPEEQASLKDIFGHGGVTYTPDDGVTKERVLGIFANLKRSAAKK
jgi:hypothetical protein